MESEDSYQRVKIVSFKKRKKHTAPYIIVAPNGCWLILTDEKNPVGVLIFVGPRPNERIGDHVTVKVPNLDELTRAFRPLSDFI